MWMLQALDGRPAERGPTLKVRLSSGQAKDISAAFGCGDVRRRSERVAMAACISSVEVALHIGCSVSASSMRHSCWCHVGKRALDCVSQVRAASLGQRMISSHHFNTPSAIVTSTAPGTE